jgi:L-ascorbate metabolism protein UlaG (beta-lactamase superfamily)
MIENIHWLGHDSFRIDGSSTVYIDPWKVPRAAPKADVILVTHDHYDHLSPDDIHRLATPATVVVGPPVVTAKIRDLETITMRAGDTVDVGTAEVIAVPAYNVDKFRAPGEVYHPKSAGHLGYIVAMDGATVYHSGDSDMIPEMEGIEVDVALVPVSGTYVMTADEAVVACGVIRARTVVPMHYGDIVGSAADARRLAERCGAAVVILPRENQ